MNDRLGEWANNPIWQPECKGAPDDTRPMRR